jgi:hypothetical protein
MLGQSRHQVVIDGLLHPKTRTRACDYAGPASHLEAGGRTGAWASWDAMDLTTCTTISRARRAAGDWPGGLARATGFRSTEGGLSLMRRWRYFAHPAADQSVVEPEPEPALTWYLPMDDSRHVRGKGDRAEPPLLERADRIVRRSIPACCGCVLSVETG